MTTLRTAVLALLLAMLSFASAPASAAEWAVPTTQVELDAASVTTPDGWVTVPGIFVEVHGDGAVRPLLVEVARHAASALPELARRLDVPLGGTVRVYVASSDAEFLELQPGRAPQWAGGTAYPSLGMIFLKTPGASGPGAKPITQVLEHELVHILLGRVFLPHEPPQWLQEGLAQVLAGELGPQTTTTLARGMATPGGLLPLDGLDRGFPEDASRAQVAYAQSAHFLGWVRSEYGDDSLQVLVREIASGASTGAAVRRATGEALDDVEQAWKRTLSPARGVPLWLSVIGSTDAWWALTGLLGLGAVFMARRRYKRRLANMRAEEERLKALERALAERLRQLDAEPAARWGPPPADLRGVVDQIH
jgi:hypothetical protein